MTSPPGGPVPLVTTGMLLTVRVLSLAAYTGVVFLLPRRARGALIDAADTLTNQLAAAVAEALPDLEPTAAEEAS